MKYKLHIPYVNRADLLRDAVASVRDVFNGDIHIWHSNTPAPDVEDVVFHALPPMPFTDLFNTLVYASWDDDVMLYMHNDGIARGDSAHKFLKFVEAKVASNDRWGFIHASHDTLCAHNMKAVRSVGFRDMMFWSYTSDADYLKQFLWAGWDYVDSGQGSIDENAKDGVFHRNGQSNTIKADWLFNHMTQYRVSFDKQYYRDKWGGSLDEEKFFYPFNGIDLKRILQDAPANTQERLKQVGSSKTVMAQLHTLNKYLIRMQPHRILLVGSSDFDFLPGMLLTDFKLTKINSIADTVYPTKFDMVWLCGNNPKNDIIGAMQLKIPCMMIDNTTSPTVKKAIEGTELDDTYHIIEPYSFLHDDRRMVVALMKNLSGLKLS